MLIQNETPKISIIMSVYNSENTVREAIDSILQQTYLNWEFVICDDASTDNSLSILNEYASMFPDRFIILHNDSNMHLSFSLNRCLEFSSGELIARMDADDRSVPTRLEKQVQYLRDHPDIDLVGTAMQRFSEKGLGLIDYRPKHPDKYTLKKQVPFYHATFMTYKSVFESLNGYVVSKRTIRGQDYDLYFRFYAKGYKGDNLDEPLYQVREDEAAFQRRTAKVRWNGFKTTCIGYNLLGFPKIWLIKPAIVMLIKMLLPYQVFRFHHERISPNQKPAD